MHNSRRSELVFRLCLYIVMGPAAGAFGGVLASAILSLDHFGSTHRWEMIFAIEGQSFLFLIAVDSRGPIESCNVNS